MTERILITKLIVTTEGRADLYGRGHRYKDLTLFDISDLVTVGFSYDGLEIGKETPCRFWAHYELSEKLNKSGNPYKDVTLLERIDTPATSTSTDTSAIVAELRAIKALLLEMVSESPPVSAGSDTNPTPILPHPPTPDLDYGEIFADVQVTPAPDPDQARRLHAIQQAGRDRPTTETPPPAMTEDKARERFYELVAAPMTADPKKWAAIVNDLIRDANGEGWGTALAALEAMLR